MRLNPTILIVVILPLYEGREDCSSQIDSGIVKLSASTGTIRKQRSEVIWTPPPRTNKDDLQFLDIEFKQVTLIRSINIKAPHLLQEFQIQYSDYGENFFRLLKQGAQGWPKTFFLYTDKDVEFNLSIPIIAKVPTR